LSGSLWVLLVLLLLLLLWQQAQVCSMSLINQQRHTLSVTQRHKLCITHSSQHVAAHQVAGWSACLAAVPARQALQQDKAASSQHVEAQTRMAH
jgi:hypothetical protein